MKVTKAVIAAAGYGTRFLPVSKNIPKEMLPVINVPSIHLVVKECIDSGINDIIIVTRYGNTAIEDYFDLDPTLYKFLTENKKEDRIQDFFDIFGKVRIAFVRQNKDLPYGNGSPLFAAKPFLNPDEAFLYMYADDITIGEPPINKQLINIFYKNDRLSAVLGTVMVDKERISKMASIKLKNNKGSDGIIDDIVEKPDPEKAPSLLGSFGRYLFTYKIFDFLDSTKLGKDNELWTVDAIRKMCKQYDVYALKVNGKWYTIGDPLNLLRTNLVSYLRHSKYKKEVIKILQQATNGEL